MFKVELKGIDDLMKRLDGRLVTSASKSALERTKTSAKSEAIRLITQRWNISKRNLEYKSSGSERIAVSGRVNDDLSATITFYSGGISLAYFGAKEYRMAGGSLRVISRSKSVTAGMRSQKKARDLIRVKVQILKGKPTTLRQFFAGVKYGKSNGVHIGVFRPDPAGGRYQTGSRRMIESQAPGVGTMVKHPQIMTPLKSFIYDTFEKRMTHELKRRGVLS
jgi:hypothetical protein